jgi:hypothetical protein
VLCFPQLGTGAVAQYPLVKRRAFRTIRNELADGRRLTLLDAGVARMEWDLQFEALTDAERETLVGFFESVEGRLGTFVWLDPTENLLRYSDALTATTWTRGPLLSLTAGVADPTGGAAATRVSNAGGAEQSIQQTINAPGWFHYCFSVFVRSNTESNLTVYRKSGGLTHQETHRAGPAWRRVMLGGATNTAAESVTFGLSLAPGGSVEVYGMQAEAQPAASAYRRTASRAGVYTGARFDDDALVFTADGPEQHRCAVRIVAPVAG